MFGFVGCEGGVFVMIARGKLDWGLKVEMVT